MSELACRETPVSCGKLTMRSKLMSVGFGELLDDTITRVESRPAPAVLCARPNLKGAEKVKLISVA